MIRVFIRPSPIYFFTVTSGAVAATNAIDSHTDLDNLHGGSEAGSMSGSRFGAMWQSYDSEGNQVLFSTQGRIQVETVLLDVFLIQYYLLLLQV